MLDFLDRLKRALTRANYRLGYVMGGFILIIDFLVVYETVARYGFNRPPIWVLEITSYLLLYIVFLGAAYTLQEGGHVRVEFGMGFLPQKAKRIVLVLADLLALCYCSVLLWQSMRFTLMAAQGNWKSTTTLALPIHYISAVIPIGALLLCLTYLLKVLDTIRPFKSSPPGDQ